MTSVLSSVPSFSSFGVRQSSAAASRSADVAGLSRVKRCLFGPRSAEEARQTALQVAAELQEQIEAASLRWNFDFGRDRPLDGRFHWSTALLTAKSTVESTTSNTSPAKRPVDQSKLRQSQITEFWQPRKRSCTSSNSPAAKRRREQVSDSPAVRRT